jgi:hypothetical protein
MRLGVEEGQAVFDLVNQKRTIRLTPVEAPLADRPPAIQDDAYTGGRVASLFGDTLAEVYFDDEEDDEE